MTLPGIPPHPAAVTRVGVPEDSPVYRLALSLGLVVPVGDVCEVCDNTRPDRGALTVVQGFTLHAGCAPRHWRR